MPLLDIAKNAIKTYISDLSSQRNRILPPINNAAVVIDGILINLVVANANGIQLDGNEFQNLLDLLNNLVEYQGQATFLSSRNIQFPLILADGKPDNVYKAIITP